MNNTEIVNYFNLSKDINYTDLGNKITEYLRSDFNDKVLTILNLIEMVSDLDWELYQYRESLMDKTYSELYSSLISIYSLNKNLGHIPNDLIQLDIKLRNTPNTNDVNKIINSTFVPIILDLLTKFNLDKSLLKILNVILITMKLCRKYHSKIKLTLEYNEFKKLMAKYPVEINYFGFKKPFTEPELKSRFRELAMKVHPDKGGSKEEFVKCKSYYDTLLKLF